MKNNNKYTLTGSFGRYTQLMDMGELYDWAFNLGHNPDCIYIEYDPKKLEDYQYYMEIYDKGSDDGEFIESIIGHGSTIELCEQNLEKNYNSFFTLFLLCFKFIRSKND